MNKSVNIYHQIYEFEEKGQIDVFILSKAKNFIDFLYHIEEFTSHQKEFDLKLINLEKNVLIIVFPCKEGKLQIEFRSSGIRYFHYTDENIYEKSFMEIFLKLI